ncbi:MAG: DUF5939 domain-containing protein [Planctomycetota bacterium]|jgi:class 3 adenylate cyclase
MAQTSSDFASRLEAIQTAGNFPKEIMARFGAFIAEAPDEKLHRTNPLLFAASAGIAETEAIALFLHATHAGVLEFSWGVLCPACASFLTTPGGLRALSQDRRCGFCQIPVDGVLDDNVEVAFTGSPAVRRIRFHEPEGMDMRSEGFHLFFSPSLPPDSPIRQLQGAILWAGQAACGEPKEVQPELAPGRYVLLAPASHSVLHLEAVEGGPETLEVDLVDGRAIPERTPVAAGKPTLRVHCRMPRGAGLMLFPDPVPPPEARTPDMKVPTHGLLPFLTGKRLLTAQAFRDLFSAQSIPSEGGLELKSLTVLFTDLKSSTEMYERVGDLQAFGLVRRHFSSLRDAVAHEGGAVVKTIGDAIMASFPEPRSAMHAAAAMDREVAGLEGGLALKIGLHAGPCIAVELNDRLDYFGRTVNIAARVQGLAGEREIVCTEPVWDAPGVADASQKAGLSPRRDEAVLKGIEGAMPVVRLHS